MGFEREHLDAPKYRRWKRDMTDKIIEMRERQALKSFNCEQCPACPAPKQKGKSFCTKCYFKLPVEQRKALYMKFGQGYELAFLRAMKTLGLYQINGNDYMRGQPNFTPRFGA